MKAARLVGPRQFEFLDIPTPELKPNEVLVKMEQLAICGSDLLTYDKVMPEEDYPWRIGLPCHECFGTVAESHDPSIPVGQRVVALTYAGGLMEYAPCAVDRIVPVPDHLPAEFAVLAQPVGTVVHAVQKMGSVLGKTVVVLGQGPIGLSFTDFLVKGGATQVIVSDIVPYRLEAAKKIGATHTINAGKDDVVEAVAEITKGAMADFSIEACGLHDTCNQAFKVLKVQGTTIIFGMPHGDPIVPFEWAAMYSKLPQMIVTNSARSNEVTPAVKTSMELMAQGRLDPSYMVTHNVPFTNVGQAYEHFSRRTDGAIKVLIKGPGV
jgi:L-iditol 2-dehydrogenase